MKNKKKLKYHRLIILLLFFIILIILIISIIARFQSRGTSVGEIETAFYVLKEDYQSMDVSLSNMVPRSEPYTYNFSISNNDGRNRAEVDLEYTLEIYTTTNLPLTYELYLNQNYNSSGATNIITSNFVESDEYGAYFRKMTTNSKSFVHTRDETNIYQIVIYFPETYKSIEYQNIIEGIEIRVSSRQIID